MTTIAAVLSWKPDQLSGVVDDLVACRRTLVDLQDELDGGQPPTSWISEAAALARPAHQRLGDDLADTVAEISSVLTSVDTEGQTLVLACQQLSDAVQHARSNGFSVDTTTGAVVDMRSTEGQTETEAADRQAVCNEMVDRIEQALRNAVSADEQMAAVLSSAATGLDVGGDLSDASDTGAGQGRSDLLPPPEGGAADQNAWWNGLTEAEQLTVIADNPRWVGNSDGIPAWARDQANRNLIDDYRSELQDEADRLQDNLDDNRFGGTFTNDDARLEDVKNKLKALDEIDDTLAMGNRQLLLLDPYSGEQLHAAVAIGDVDTADHVAAFTPGLTSTVQDSLGDYDSHMAELQRLSEAEASRAGGDDGSVATVTWIGYDAPQMGMDLVNPGRSVLNDDLAQAGAGDLNDFYNGIDASRDDDPHLTALGHSYGSLTTGLALQQQNGVDDMVIFGSPGLGTSDIGDIDVPDDHSFRIEAKNDAVADGGVFGIDPSHMDGMTGLSAKDAELGGEEFEASGGHSEYLNGDTTSQHNMAAVISGNSDRIVYDDGRGAGDVLSWPVPGTY
ncbi:alpha/beta hydrolase [Aeromicrobium sp. SMF47]|uniref:alpha/beta hydrolase n=1 Tax=Aeromicrobium yanjiei TaxID=2662028 RepID=UPI00129E77C1|nr:alpha/beta hydrolase [Aeromicrobium yanjiei]MRJ76602.1 alpha/beta hydrolase [Aeromicrobium yanjiei]